jgi:hypothetical protein
MYMSPEEKRISFMNRYFAFKKVRDVDVKKMAHIILKETEFADKHGEEEVKELEKAVDERDKADKKEKEEGDNEPIVKKTNRLVLKKQQERVQVPLPETSQPKAPTVSIGKEKIMITVKK